MKKLLEVLKTISTVLQMVNGTVGTIKSVDNNLGKIAYYATKNK